MQEFIDAVHRGHLLAASFAAFAIGIIASARGDGNLVVVACVVAILVSIPAIARLQTASRSLLRVLAASSCIGMLCASAALRRESAPAYAALDGHHIFARVIALDRPRDAGDGTQVRAQIQRVMAPGVPAAAALRGLGVLLIAPAAHWRAVAGHSLFVRARVEMPAGPRNEGERSERDILADQGIGLVLRAHGRHDVIVADPAAGWSAWWARLRAACADEVEARLAPMQATVLEGILWGDRGDLPASLRQEFSDTGTVHVLTTAGLHLGIMSAIVAGLLSGVPLRRRARVAIVVAAAWAYAMLAGFHLPTYRAATMLTVGVLAQESGRARTPSAVLAAAAFAVCLPHPLALLSPSFAMSFACVTGIALVSPALAGLGLSDKLGAPRFIVELVRTSLAVQLAMWPLQALYFNVFTPYAVVANLLVVPLVGLVMAGGGTLVFVSAVAPFLSPSIANLTSWLLTLLISIVEKTASLPAAHLDVPPPNVAFIIAYWAGLGAFAWAAARGMRLRTAIAGSAAACCVLAGLYVVPGIAAALDPRLHLDAIDVGQADCLLVRAPGMHAMLVDGGGRLERGARSGEVVAQPIGDRIAVRTVMPFLLRHWVMHLDAVVLTHPHGDHAGGLPVILERERVGALYDSAQLYGGPAYHRALGVVRERRIRWIRAQRGVSFDLGTRAHVRILAPEMPLLSGTASDINNNSVVARLEFGAVAMLLTGDAQSEAEARLLSHGGADLRAEVLKVGHHGSAYSSTPAFLAAVHPKIAIVSCGLHNVFGHPSPRTLAALRAIGARIYRTDLDGGISMQSDGRDVSAAVSISPSRIP